MLRASEVFARSLLSPFWVGLFTTMPLFLAYVILGPLPDVRPVISQVGVL